MVLELGNAWEQGHPVMSPLALVSLLKFLEIGRFKLCQQFVCYNPARLPGPAQWVNVERVRVKDSYTHVWWMSHTDRPKADNRKVLVSYSRAMQQLLESGKYSASPRRSGHRIGVRTFLRKNAGAIPSNLLRFANTRSNNDPYLKYCRKRNLRPHPARMARGLAEFFIKAADGPNRAPPRTPWRRPSSIRPLGIVRSRGSSRAVLILLYGISSCTPSWERVHAESVLETRSADASGSLNGIQEVRIRVLGKPD